MKLPKVNEITEGEYKIFDWKIISDYAKITGDSNPIHTDLEYAETTIFKEPIAQGILTASLISALLGQTYKGIIYKNQKLFFIKPVRINTKLKAVIKCISVIPIFVIYKNYDVGFETKVIDEHGNVYIDGTAKMFVWGEKI